MICRSVVNLESLKCIDEEAPCEHMWSVLWSLLKSGNYFGRLKKIDFSADPTRYIDDPETLGIEIHPLPESLSSVIISLCGTEAQQLRLFHDLDQLPNLDQLEITLQEFFPPYPPTHLELVRFPKLLRCLRQITGASWPRDADLLAKSKALEKLNLYRSVAMEVADPALWTALARLPKLKELRLGGCPVCPHRNPFYTSDQRNSYLPWVLDFG